VFQSIVFDDFAVLISEIDEGDKVTQIDKKKTATHVRVLVSLMCITKTLIENALRILNPV